MSFLNLRIRGRLYGGFGILLLFCAGLAGFGVWQLWSIQIDVTELTVQSANRIRVGDISTELQAARRAILRYAFDHDEPSFAEAEQRLTKSADLLDEAIRTTTSDGRRVVYKEVAKNVADLKAKRAALGDMIKQMLVGRDLLFSEGDKMAADVQKFVDIAEKAEFARQANALLSKVLLVRVACGDCGTMSESATTEIIQSPRTRWRPL
jgi:hypothetical protein